jgi:hypothetical protein
MDHLAERNPSNLVESLADSWLADDPAGHDSFANTPHAAESDPSSV